MRKRKRVKPTLKEKALAESFVRNNGDLVKVEKEMIKDEGIMTKAIMPEILMRPTTQSEISKILDETGLSERSLAGKMHDVLTSEKRGHKEENELKAIRMAFELHGSFAPIKVEVSESPYAKLSILQLQEAVRKLLESFGTKKGS